MYVVVFIVNGVLDDRGFKLFYVALWEDEEVAFLRLTCQAQV